MTKLHVEDFDDVKTGYRISFHFKENPYFENDVITKEFHLAAENQSDNFTQTSSSTQIKWKDGKDLLKELQSKPQSNKKRDADHKSFFDWFCDTHVRLSKKFSDILMITLNLGSIERWHCWNDQGWHFSCKFVWRLILNLILILESTMRSRILFNTSSCQTSECIMMMMSQVVKRLRKERDQTRRWMVKISLKA